MSSLYKSKNKGFTVIEIILVLALGALLTGFIALSFSKVNEHEALDTNADLVVSVLNEARSLTLSSVGNTRYGVHFDADQVVLFSGASYSSGAASNVPTALNPRVALRNISFGGGSNVVFDRLTGATSQSGALQIYLKSATTTYKTISVSATGLSERN
jgi:prepilin-type N-terminal cleavage/methylation domain-containing protein